MTVSGTFSIITTMLVLTGVLPIWPWSRAWGYRAAGIVAAILLVLLVLLFNNRI
ncbi:MAG: DUF3309 family protein [Mesorhizobium sp.]